MISKHFDCTAQHFYYGLPMSSSALSKDDENPVITPISGLQQPIVLIGLMGAGKTTIGRRLAQRIGLEFVDSDVEIEEAAACSIADIFVIHGEPIFRDLEARVIRRLLEAPGHVIATGGGAWMQPAIREMIAQNALSIWLKADLDTLVERVERRNHRPLLEQGDKRDILQGLMDQRYPVYATADLTVESGDGPHEQVVERIIDTISHHVKATS